MLGIVEGKSIFICSEPSPLHFLFLALESSTFRNRSPISASHANIATGWSLKVSRGKTSLAIMRKWAAAFNEAVLSLARLILFTIVYIGLKSSQAGLVVLMTVRLMF